MEIPPSTSLIAALSDFTETRRAEAADVRQQERLREESQRPSDSTAANQRVQVSSERELEAARDAARQANDVRQADDARRADDIRQADDARRTDDARQADEQAFFRREAPTAGTEERNQPPGQIIDISV